MADHKKRGDIGKGKKSKSKSSKHAHEIHIRRAKSGELLAKHKYASKAGEPEMGEEEHVVPEGQLDAHVAEHMPPDAQSMAPPSPAPGGMLGGGGM